LLKLINKFGLLTCLLITLRAKLRRSIL